MVMYHDRIRKQKTKTQLRCLDKNQKYSIPQIMVYRSRLKKNKSPKTTPRHNECFKDIAQLRRSPTLSKVWSSVGSKILSSSSSKTSETRVFSFRGSGVSRNLNDWLQKGKPQRKNPHPTKTGTDLGEFLFEKVGSCINVEISFLVVTCCYYESLYNKTKELNDSSLQHIGPRMYFLLKINNLPESTCHCCQPFGNKRATIS